MVTRCSLPPAALCYSLQPGLHEVGGVVLCIARLALGVHAHLVGCGARVQAGEGGEGREGGWPPRQQGQQTRHRGEEVVGQSRHHQEPGGQGKDESMGKGGGGG